MHVASITRINIDTFIENGRKKHTEFFTHDDSPLLQWIRKNDTVKLALNSVLKIQVGSRFNAKSISSTFKSTDLRAITANAIFHRLGIAHTTLMSLNESFKYAEIGDLQEKYAHTTWFKSFLDDYIIGLINFNSEFPF